MSNPPNIPNFDPSGPPDSGDTPAGAVVNSLWKGIMQLNTRLETEENNRINQTLSMQNSIDDALRRVAQLESENTDLNTKLADARTQVTGLDGQLKHASTVVSGLNARIQDLETKNTSLESTITSLQSTISTSSGGVAVVTQQTRDPKMSEPKKYEGKQGQEFDDFVSSLTVYFGGMPITYGPLSQPNHNARVQYTLGLLSGPALTWAQFLIRSMTTSTPHVALSSYSTLR